MLCKRSKGTILKQISEKAHSTVVTYQNWLMTALRARPRDRGLKGQWTGMTGAAHRKSGATTPTARNHPGIDWGKLGMWG